MAMVGGVLGFAESDSEDELPSGWEERTNEDGRVYYANHSEKTTQWTHPRTGKKKKLEGDLPEGWEKRILDGKIVFVNHKESRTTYTDPRLAFAVEDNEPVASVSSSNTRHLQTTPTKSQRQRFDASTKAMQILHGIDLNDRTFAITGANSGIGFEVARCLATHNAHVVMLCRNVRLAEFAKHDIKSQKHDAKIDIIECDLSSLKSVRNCVNIYLKNNWPLHCLILNAAIQGSPFQLSEDGIEMTFAVNFLGHFYLTTLLQQKLLESAPARVVAVSSESHRFVDLLEQLTEDNFTEEKLSPSQPSHYWWMYAYNVSKLCLILFAFELNKRLSTRRVYCNALHPGNMMSTNLVKYSYCLRILFALVRPFTKSTEQGGSTSIYCAVAPELENIGGRYFNNCWFCEPSKLAENEKLQKKLWLLSEEMIERALTRT